MARWGGERDGGDSDCEMIARSARDPEHFTAVVDAHADTIYRYLVRRVGVDAAEDLASETFLRAFRARSGYRQEQPSALPWLYGIATNLVRDHARRERRRLDALVRAASADIEYDGRDRVDEQMSARTVLRDVVMGIAALPDDARDVVVLIAVEGLSYAETATALGLPMGTVRSRLSRARRELRRSLDPATGAHGPAADRSGQRKEPAAEAGGGTPHG